MQIGPSSKLWKLTTLVEYLLLFYSAVSSCGRDTCVTGAVVCPALSVSHATLNTTDANYRSSVHVTCNEGYSFDPHNLTDKYVDTVCTRLRTWSTTVLDCQRTWLCCCYINIACVLTIYINLLSAGNASVCLVLPLLVSCWLTHIFH